MNIYSLGALIAVWSVLSRTTATIGGAHLPALWLLAAAVVLALAAVVLWLVRSIARDGGWWLAMAPEGAS